VVNLAVNARDAMRGGGVLSIDTANVTVGADQAVAGPAEHAGRYVRLRVGDTGTGMSPEVVAHVFEPFFTTKPDGIGTGLGLATVYGIVTRLNATIDISTSPGCGTTFTIMVPVTQEVAVQIEDDTAQHPTPAGETILIVEDEQALREVTERILEWGGYHVLAAADGAEALALAAAYGGRIHLLLTDVIMPRMRGVQVAAAVRHIKPDIDVLYMSGYAQPVLVSRGALEGDVNLIEKPFSAVKLIAKVAHLINSPH
jgi:CheY-like chemotaxis protein